MTSSGDYGSMIPPDEGSPFRVETGGLEARDIMKDLAARDEVSNFLVFSPQPAGNGPVYMDSTIARRRIDEK